MKKTVLLLILLGVLVSAGCSKPLCEKKIFDKEAEEFQKIKEDLICHLLWSYRNREKLADIEKHRADK